jgi:amino acid permease
MLFRALVNIPLDILVVIPLSSMRDMSSLSFNSKLTVLALFYCAILLIVELPWYNREYKQMENYKETVFLLDYNFFQACAMTFFAYTCQVQLLPIFSELVRPSYNRIKKVVVYSFIIDFIVYATVASAGYFSTYNYTNPIVIYRTPLPNYDPDYSMIVCAVGILVVMINCFPVNFNPWRQAVFVFILKNPNFSKKA